MAKWRASTAVTPTAAVSATGLPSRLSCRSVQSMLAAFMSRENTNSSVPTGVLRKPGVGACRLSTTGAVAPIAQSMEALLVPALPDKSVTPTALTLRL